MNKRDSKPPKPPKPPKVPKSFNNGEAYPLSSLSPRVRRILNILNRGGINVREAIDKDGGLKKITNQELLQPIDQHKGQGGSQGNSQGGNLLHHLAMNGLLDQIPKEYLTVQNLNIKDSQGCDIIMLAGRFKCLHQIPKAYLSKEKLKEEFQGTTLLHLTIWGGNLELIDKKILNDKKTLELEDYEGESVIEAIMAIIDNCPQSKYSMAYRTNPQQNSISKAYKEVLPKLLSKLTVSKLKSLKKKIIENSHLTHLSNPSHQSPRYPKSRKGSIKSLDSQIASKKMESQTKNKQLII